MFSCKQNIRAPWTLHENRVARCQHCITFVLFRQLSSIGPHRFLLWAEQAGCFVSPRPTCSYSFPSLGNQHNLRNHEFVLIVYTCIHMYTIYPPKVCTGRIFEDRSRSTEETWFDFGPRLVYPDWLSRYRWKSMKGCHTRIWPQEVTEWAADGFTSPKSQFWVIPGTCKYYQTKSNKFKYLSYWSRRAL